MARDFWSRSEVASGGGNEASSQPLSERRCELYVWAHRRPFFLLRSSEGERSSESGQTWNHMRGFIIERVCSVAGLRAVEQISSRSPRIAPRGQFRGKVHGKIRNVNFVCALSHA